MRSAGGQHRRLSSARTHTHTRAHAASVAPPYDEAVTDDGPSGGGPREAGRSKIYTTTGFTITSYTRCVVVQKVLTERARVLCAQRRRAGGGRRAGGLDWLTAHDLLPPPPLGLTRRFARREWRTVRAQRSNRATRFTAYERDLPSPCARGVCVPLRVVSTRHIRPAAVFFPSVRTTVARTSG